MGVAARLCGLSIGALRHYDSVGVLVPAAVDGTTSHRRYRREQLDTARWVAQPAVHHARRCLDNATLVTDEPWLLASAYEGLARAYSVAGDKAAAGEWKAKAETQIALGPGNREIVERDIATLPL